MKKGLLQLASAFLLLVLLGQKVYADAISVERIENTIAVGVVIVLGFLVIGIVLSAAQVIKGIKKKYGSKENDPIDQ